MAGIIEDLLELSVHGKPPAGEVLVTPVVLELLDELRTDLRDAEVKLELGDCTTACSAGTLSQILRNLVINAVVSDVLRRHRMVEVAWVRSADNPADAPSRGRAPDLSSLQSSLQTQLAACFTPRTTDSLRRAPFTSLVDGLRSSNREPRATGIFV